MWGGIFRCRSPNPSALAQALYFLRMFGQHPPLGSPSQPRRDGSVKDRLNGKPPNPLAHLQQPDITLRRAGLAMLWDPYAFD